MGNWYTDPVNEELSIEDIRQKAENGEFHEWNFTPFEYQESGYEDVIDELKKYKAVDYLNLDDKRKKAVEAGNTVEAEGYRQQMEKMVEDVLNIYRSKNIFPIQYFSELGVMDEIEKCIAYKAKFDGDTVSCVTGDTEYFNGKEWKKMYEYVEGDRVLQYNLDGTAELVKPLRYIHNRDSKKFYIEDTYGSDLLKITTLPSAITGDHRVIYYNINRDVAVDALSVVFERSKVGEFNAKEDLEVPTGCIYEGTVTVDKSVLQEAYNSVNEQKFVNGNILITKKENNVCFSDECCSLTLENRRYLLSLFGINKDSSRDDSLIANENLDWNIEIVKSINNFLFLTYNSILVAADQELSDGDLFIFNNLTISDNEEYYEEFYERDKYCFSVPSSFLVLRREGSIFITGNCGAGIGTGLCRWLFPNLFDTPSAHDLTKKDAETQYKKFLNDEYLKRAIKFCYSYKDGCPTPTSVEGGLRLVGSAPSNFRPMNAKAVYERFCPKGGTIYDFCCVDGSTEFFTGSGWKRIDQYEDGDMVLQFKEDGTGELVEPIRYISYESDDPFYEFNSEWLASCLTGNHDIVYRMPKIQSFISDNSKSLISNVCGGRIGGKLYTNSNVKKCINEFVYKKIKQEEIIRERFNKEIPLTFEGEGGNLELSDNELKLLAYSHNNMALLDKEFGTFSVFLKTEEQLNKFINLLESMYEAGELEEYTYGFANIKTSGFIIEFKYKNLVKCFNMDYAHFNEYKFEKSYCVFSNIMYCLTKSCSVKFAEYISEWYGDTYSTLSLNNSDVVQYMFVSNGCGAYIKSVKYGKSSRMYTVHIGENDQVGYYNNNKPTLSSLYKVVEDKHKYCFEVPSHMLVLRRSGKVFITGNCGFGGRMLGALSSKNNYRYVGTDPCTETMYHLHELGEYIEMVTGREDSYELHCCGSEVFRGPANSIDFAFSSPPYFNLEVYSDEPTQCYNKFPKLEEWLEGYVRATIKNIYHMLKPGHFYAVNIADFKVGGGGEVAYVDEWKRISAEEGMPLFDTVYLGVTARAGSAEQAAGELKKENIMIFKKPL